jgi:hypothetical protein
MSNIKKKLVPQASIKPPGVQKIMLHEVIFVAICNAISDIEPCF